MFLHIHRSQKIQKSCHLINRYVCSTIFPQPPLLRPRSMVLHPHPLVALPGGAPHHPQTPAPHVPGVEAQLLPHHTVQEPTQPCLLTDLNTEMDQHPHLTFLPGTTRSQLCLACLPAPHRCCSTPAPTCRADMGKVKRWSPEQLSRSSRSRPGGGGRPWCGGTAGRGGSGGKVPTPPCCRQGGT